MQTPKIAVLAFALLGVWAGTASAATVDYKLTVPLVDISATSPVPIATLTGTLAYDGDMFSGSGVFGLVGATDNSTEPYTGLASILALGNGTSGVLFQGQTSIGSLYFNLIANLDSGAILSGPVTYCPTGICTLYTAAGGTLLPAGSTPVLPPDTGSSPVVSPVPLPPAVSLFGAALLGLAALAAGRRRWARRDASARA